MARIAWRCSSFGRSARTTLYYQSYGGPRTRTPRCSSGYSRTYLDQERRMTSCTPAASPSTSPPPPPPRRRGSRPPTPRSSPSTVDGHTLLAGQPPGLVPDLAGLPRVRRRPDPQLATRYHDHPALAMWHVSNEYALPQPALLLRRLRRRTSGAWLQRRYETLDRLNDAWGTAFWSQRYTDWEQVLPPRRSTTFNNPTHVLDYKRFSSDALLDFIRGRAGRPRRAVTRRPGDDELHDPRPLPPPRLPPVGAHRRRRQHRPLHRRPRSSTRAPSSPSAAT